MRMMPRCKSKAGVTLVEPYPRTVKTVNFILFKPFTPEEGLAQQPGENICSDAKVWFDCYKAENQECNSKLIDKYAKFVEKTYNKLASSCQRVEL